MKIRKIFLLFPLLFTLLACSSVMPDISLSFEDEKEYNFGNPDNINILNTNAQGINLMFKPTFDSYVFSEKNFILIAVESEVFNLVYNKEIEKQNITINNKYIQWLYDGICYHDIDYKCHSLSKDSRLNIFLGSLDEIDDLGTNTPSIFYFSGKEIQKTTPLSQLRNSSSFRNEIANNIYFSQNNFDFQKYNSINNTKTIVLDESNIKYNPSTESYYFDVLEEKIANKETFILLTTSKDRSKYCFNSENNLFFEIGIDYVFDEVDCLLEDVLDETLYETKKELYNICNQKLPANYIANLQNSRIPFYDNYLDLNGNITVCEFYEANISRLSEQYGFTYYVVEMDSYKKKAVIDEYIFLRATPQISIFANGELVDEIFGLVDYTFIENELQMFGLYSDTVTLGMKCIGSNNCIFSIGENEDITLELFYSAINNARYFINSSNEISVASKEEFILAFEDDDLAHISKAEFIDDPSIENKETKLINLLINNEGVYYIYMYSENKNGDFKILRLKFQIIINE